MSGPAKRFDLDEALEHAMQLFRARGYEGTSISELMAVMGIAKKSLYDTFGGKRALFLAAIRRYSEAQVAAVRGQLERPGPPLRNVARLLREWQRHDSEPGSKGCLLGTNCAHFDVERDPEVATVLRDNLRRVEDEIHRALVRARDAGELAADASPRDLARMLLCLSQGVALLGRVLPTGTVQRGSVTAALSLLDAA